MHNYLFITRDSGTVECYNEFGNIAMIITAQDNKAMATGGLDQAKDEDVFTYVNHLHGREAYIDFMAASKADATRIFDYTGDDHGRCSFADLLYNMEHGDQIEPNDLEALRTCEVGQTVDIGIWMGQSHEFTRVY